MLEACNDLRFLKTPFEGADFVLALALEKLPSRAGFVSLFDMDQREFVVVRQTGGSDAAILVRLPERALIADGAVQARRAIVIADTAGDTRVQYDERWEAMGFAPSSVICAPVEIGGRCLGLIEIADPIKSKRFSETDGELLTYIGQQYAAFVAAHGIALDPQEITRGAKKGPLR